MVLKGDPNGSQKLKILVKHGYLKILDKVKDYKVVTGNNHLGGGLNPPLVVIRNDVANPDPNPRGGLYLTLSDPDPRFSPGSATPTGSK